jgi:hypothetical protein
MAVNQSRGERGKAMRIMLTRTEGGKEVQFRNPALSGLTPGQRVEMVVTGTLDVIAGEVMALRVGGQTIAIPASARLGFAPRAQAEPYDITMVHRTAAGGTW